MKKTVKLTLLLLTISAVFARAPVGAVKRVLVPPPFQQVSFDRDIRPIFATRCLNCHGEKKQNGGLRLDAKAFAMRGGQSGPAIVAGNALASRLYQRISAQDDDERMPPVGERLSAAETALIKAWVDAGAVWPEGDAATGRPGDGASDPAKHWAWLPIKKPAVPTAPAIRNPQSAFSNGRNPIDAFIAARLAQSGLQMSPEADRRTLIRRLSFDLLGLPPTPEMLESFVADQSPDAYERLVDRMLASP